MIELIRCFVHIRHIGVLPLVVPKVHSGLLLLQTSRSVRRWWPPGTASTASAWRAPIGSVSHGRGSVGGRRVASVTWAWLFTTTLPKKCSVKKICRRKRQHMPSRRKSGRKRSRSDRSRAKLGRSGRKESRRSRAKLNRSGRKRGAVQRYRGKGTFTVRDGIALVRGKVNEDIRYSI